MTAAIGVGVMLAGMCGLRMASDDARFACPEVDYGLIGGSAGLLASLGMPEAKVREIVYTRRELEDAGFFNCVVSRQPCFPWLWIWPTRSRPNRSLPCAPESWIR